MATMKITVDELKFKKTIYSKAAKNLRDVIDVVKKARSSIGNDKMFEEARQSLAKLAENMDRRATVLEALAEALTYSSDTYKGAQTRSVSMISDYKAHKTDFYGNPVHVSGAAGGAAAAAAGGAAVAGGGGGAQTSHTGSTTATSATESTPAGNYTENNTVVFSKTENVTINAGAAPEAATTAGAAAAETVSAGAGTAASEVAAAAAGTGASAGAMFAAGAGAVAAAAGAAAAGVGIAKAKKKKARESSIDYQLEEAKKKLQAIEDEQDELRANLAEDEEE